MLCSTFIDTSLCYLRQNGTHLCVPNITIHLHYPFATNDTLNDGSVEEVARTEGQNSERIEKLSTEKISLASSNKNRVNCCVIPVQLTLLLKL